MSKHFHNDSALEAPFAVLVAKGLLAMIDELDESFDTGNEYNTGIHVFDSLTTEQQAFMVHKVAFALLDPKTERNLPTAVFDGTVAALFEEIQTHVELELDCDDEHSLDEDVFYWRSAVRDCCFALFQKSFPMDQTHDQWLEDVKNLAEVLLDGSDYEEDWLLDETPRRMHKAMAESRIPQGYFQYTPNDLPEDDCRYLLEEARELCEDTILRV